MTPGLVFDGLLCLLVIGVAIGAVVARELLAAVVFFVVYGLFVSVAWVRLDAIDVALAEAAIGAGLTGLLLIGAAGRLRRDGAHARPRAAPAERPRWRVARRAVTAVVSLAAATALASVVLSLPEDGAGLIAHVDDRLAVSGVTNPVTAVLLNFRAYDTLLESVVILTALVAVWSLSADAFWGGLPGPRQHAVPDGVLATLGRLLLVVGFLVGIHLLWAGSHAPGGAFQAGTVLAAVWVLVAMAGLAEAPPVASIRLRLALVFGPAVFLVIGTAGLIRGAFLGFPPDAAKVLILVIEASLTVSIAATLALLVLGVPRRQP